jgi:hypothetical protein
MERKTDKKAERASDNPEKLRAVTLAIARTKIMFGERGVIDLYRRMAINVLDETKMANEIKDAWSQDYDELIEKIDKAAKEARRYR